jgi:hypothetical protein
MVTEKPQISLQPTTGSDPAAVTVPVLELETARVVALAREIVPVVVALQTGQAVVAPQIGPVVVELQTGQAAAELRTDPVEAALQIDRVAAGLRTGRVVALPRGRRHAHLVALPGTKSVIAPHHRDRVRLLAEEDLAAAAETTRAPAATEAIKA